MGLPAGKQVEFLQEYQKDALELQRLQKEFEDAQQIADTGNIGAYAKMANEATDKSRAVKDHIEAMRRKYAQYGIPVDFPDKRVVGIVNKQIEFLNRLEAMKLEAAQDLRKIEAEAPSSDPDVHKAHMALCDFADKTSSDDDRLDPHTTFSGKSQKDQNALNARYEDMVDALYYFDWKFARNEHRADLEGQGRVGAYDIIERTGINIQFREWGMEGLGVRGEHGYFARMLHSPVQGFLPTTLSLGGMSKLGEFKVERTHYTDDNGHTVNGLDGKPLTGPATSITIQQISIYGGYGVVAKAFYRANDRARVMQAVHALGGLLSSHLYNPALNLNMAEADQALKDGKITAVQHKGMKDAKAAAEAQLETFKKEGFTLDKLPPGYGGLDFYYQMEATASMMGIPFNPNGPSLEQLLEKQYNDAPTTNLRNQAETAAYQNNKRGVSMRQAARQNLVEFAEGTREYKSIRDSLATSRLITKLEGYKGSTDPHEAAMYDKFKAYEADFKLKHANAPYMNKDGTIKDREAYRKALTQSLTAHHYLKKNGPFHDEFKAIVHDLETNPTLIKDPILGTEMTQKQSMVNNALGAHATGRPWWKRAEKDNGVTAELEGSGPEGVTAETDDLSGASKKHGMAIHGGKSEPTMVISRADSHDLMIMGASDPAKNLQEDMAEHDDLVITASNKLKDDLLITSKKSKTSTQPPSPPPVKEKEAKANIVANVANKAPAAATPKATNATTGTGANANKSSTPKPT